MNDDIRRLEEKIAFLEHHVTQQDKVMVEFGEEIARLRREMQRLVVRLESGAGPTAVGGEAGDLPHERPPHY